MWRNEWGDETPNRDQMCDFVMKHMDMEDLEHELYSTLDFSRLLAWACKQDGFCEAFKDEVHQAKQNFFNNYAWEVDDEDECFEPGRPIIDMCELNP